jgi:hypothetical protein
MRTTVGVIAGTLVVSLALWCLFWTQDMALTPGDTLVVVGLSGALVFAVRWVVGTLLRRRRTHVSEPKGDA